MVWDLDATNVENANDVFLWEFDISSIYDDYGSIFGCFIEVIFTLWLPKDLPTSTRILNKDLPD